MKTRHRWLICKQCAIFSCKYLFKSLPYYILISVASKKRIHSYKLLNLSEYEKFCHRDADYTNKFPEDIPDIPSFAESDDIYMRIQCERQFSIPLRYLTMPIVCIYMSQFILLPSLYYRTLSHFLLLLNDNKYFPILFAFLYMPFFALPVIKSRKYIMLDFFLIMAMVTKLLLFTKRFVKFIILFVVIRSYIVFICYMKFICFYIFFLFFYLHISVPSETFIGLDVFISVIPFFNEKFSLIFGLHI